jgi:2-iminobutanoate/2-iminopropanoate deaminase
MNPIKRALLTASLFSTIGVYGQATSPPKQEQIGPVQFLNSAKVAQVPGYSQAAVVSGGKMIFVSGQVGLNRAGEIVGKDDFRVQTTQAFANLRKILAAAGASPTKVVKLNFYVVGLNKQRLQTLRAVRDSYIDKDYPPASSLVGVQALFRKDCLVEIEAVAVIP